MYVKAQSIETLTTDVLVIGGGMAGCRAAIAAADNGSNVILAAKKSICSGGASTFPVAEMAGYNAGEPQRAGSVEKHYYDIVHAGQGMADPVLAQILAINAPSTITELEKWGITFEKEGDDYYIFKSCFASAPRTHVIRGHGGSIVRAMARQIALRHGISVMDSVTIVELSQHDGICCGAWAVCADGDLKYIKASAVIIASGGASQIFMRNMNPPDVCGDGYALAYKAGAELINMEFIQCGIGFSHPIVNMFNGYIWAAHPKLTNADSKPFLQKYLPLGISPEHAMDEHRRHFPFSSSDNSKYLEIGIQKEIRSGGGTTNMGVRVDLRHMTDDYIKSLPDDCGLHHMWRVARDYIAAKGVDLLERTAEVAVFAHAVNGGVNIDKNAASTIPGLYAAGEAAGGPHGADRLGGNMMVTCQVFGKIAGENASRWSRVSKLKLNSVPTLPEQIMHIMHKKLDTGKIMDELRTINQNSLLVCRSDASLRNVLQFTERAMHAIEGSPTQNDVELDNFRLYSMLQSSRLIALASLERKESRGAHFREDYPQKDPAMEHPIIQKA